MASDDAAWNAAWRRLIAACGEARRRAATGAGPRPGGAVDYPAMAPPPTPSPERPAIRDDLAALAALTRAYLLSHASSAPAVTVALLVTSRGPDDLAFGVNVLPGAEPLPAGGIAPAIVLEASRALLTAPIVRAGRLTPLGGGRLAFEAADRPGIPGAEPGGEPADLAALVLAAFEMAGRA